jgi:DNA repair exonuclease SbcCD ATPase subunit
VTKPASDEGRELDEIAAELYGLRPDDFAAARDEQVRKARAEGRPPLARELTRLRRPTQSAWLINLLWRDQRDGMEQLLQLGEDLGRAQAQASGPELLRLTARRRELEAALMRGARALAEDAGVTVTASMEREAQETLAAALAVAAVANEVRTGRLVKPAAYAGFGTLLPSAPMAPPAAARQASADVGAVVGAGEHSVAAASRPPKTDDREASVENRARERREEAERRVQEARATLESAAAALADAGGTADAALRRQQALRKQVEQIQEQIRDLQLQLSEVRKEVLAAGQAAVTSAGRRDLAERAHETALRALERAEQSLKDLP